MRISDDDLRAIWQERSENQPADCLTDTAWARLLSSEAEPAERARAAAHIASCSTCADDYRVLQPLKSWAADVNQLYSPLHRAPAGWWTGWRTAWSWPQLALAAATIVLLATQAVMLFQLAAGRRQSASLETQLADNRRRLSGSESSLSTLQQRLLSETAAKEQLEIVQRQDRARLSTPQLDTTIVDLQPRVADAVRGASGSQVVTTTPNALATTLVLNFPPLESPATLEVEVANADAIQQIRWTGRTEREQDAAAVTLALPAAGYPDGEYVIRVFNITRGRALLAAYRVLIRQRPERQ